MAYSKKNPKISIIVPVYNTDKYLAECLDSVLAQTFQDFEVICVNDGSPDNSQKILDEYAARDARIKVLFQKNAGVVAARNNAISESNGKYLFPLDSDDKIAPDCLEHLLKHLESGKCDVATPKVFWFGEKSGELVMKKPSKLNMSRGNCLVNAALFDKKYWVKYGGYDPLFNEALEDYDFWANFIYDNKKICNVPDAVFYYRAKSSAESRNSSTLKRHKKIHKLILNKHPEMRLYLIFNKLLRVFYKKQIRNNYKIIKILGIKVYNKRK